MDDRFLCVVFVSCINLEETNQITSNILTVAKTCSELSLESDWNQRARDIGAHQRH